MQRIFLETTIQIQRLIYAPDVRNSINTAIQNYEALTSTYVWMEVQRTIGQDYRHLIDLLHQKLPRTISQFMHELGTSQHTYSARRLGRMIHIMAEVLDEFQEPQIDPFEVADFLQRRQEWAIHHEFFNGIDTILDTTTCDLVKPSYTIPQGGRMSCRRETAQCALPHLLEQNLESIQQMSSSTLSLLDVSTQKALSRITENIELSKGERTCWPLGDLIIVLECPPDAFLWTTNVSHFEPLGKNFSRKLYAPDSN